MNQAVIHGFVKKAADTGITPEQAAALWKQANAMLRGLSGAMPGGSAIGSSALANPTMALGSNSPKIFGQAANFLTQPRSIPQGVKDAGGALGKGMGIGAGVGGAGAGIGLAMQQGPAGTAGAEPGLQEKIMQFIQQHPYLTAGGIGAAGLGLGAAAGGAFGGNEEEEQ
jgi:hypothetical protein